MQSDRVNNREQFLNYEFLRLMYRKTVHHSYLAMLNETPYTEMFHQNVSMCLLLFTVHLIADFLIKSLSAV